MAARDLLDYIDDTDDKQYSTPRRQFLLPGASSSPCLSSSRKSGKFRKLYTPEPVNENRPYTKRRKLSSVSHNATIGNTSHINSSLDIVDTTPSLESTKSHLYNQTATGLQGDNLKSIFHSELKSLCDVNKSRFISSTSMNTESENMEKVERRNKLKRNVTKGVTISGISSLIKSPVSKFSEMSTSEDYTSDTLSSTTDETSGKSKTPSNGKTSNRLLYTHETSHNGEVSNTMEKEVLLQTPDRLNVNHRRDIYSAMETLRQAKSNGLIQGRKTETPTNYQNLERIVEIKSRSHQSFASPLKQTQEDLPPTQPVSTLILKDIIAYVEVRSGGDNRSMGIKAHMKSLGATVRDKFTNDVTHVVFNEGLPSTYKKAMKKNVHLVSVLWIEECKKAQTIVSERLYPPCDIEKYESPLFLKKFRKVRSFQPDFEEMGERKRRRRKKTVPEKENEPEIELPEYPSYKKNIKVPEFLENASKENELVRALLSVADIGPEYEEVVNRPTSPTLSEEEDMPNPPTLAVRLLRKMLTPKSSPGIDSRDETSDHRQHNSSGPIEEMTPKRQLIPSMRLGHSLNSDQAAEKQDISKTPGENSEANSTPSDVKRNTKTLVKSPKLAGNNKMLKKLSKSSINNAASIGVVEEISKQVSSSECGTVVLPAAEEEENTNKLTKKNNEQKATKRRYSKINEIADKILNAKCAKQLITSFSKDDSSSRTTLNKKDITENTVVGEDSLNDTLKDIKDNKGLSVRKRKLMTLHRTDSPEELDISNVEEETTITSHCPYSPEERPKKKRKVMTCASAESKVELKPSMSNTGSSKVNRKIKMARRKCDFFSDNKHETVSKVGCSSRGSSGEFVVRAPQIVHAENETKSEKKLPSLVCTGLQRHEVEVVVVVVNKLGSFVMEEKVSANTTHVITSGPKRTLNLLKGIARGCWIVLQEWVLRSFESEKWLDEDEFELSDFSPAVQQCRIERLSFGRYYKQELFSQCGSIYVSNQSVPPKQDLEDLIKLCGGHVVSARRSAELMMVASGTGIRT